MQVCKDDALGTWKSTIAGVHPDVGFTPAGVLLSAYGYFDGSHAAPYSAKKSRAPLKRGASQGSNGGFTQQHPLPAKGAGADVGSVTAGVNASRNDGNGRAGVEDSAAAGADIDNSGGDDGPVSYVAFGAACSEVEIDVLTGERVLKRVDIMYDCGWSLNPMIDLGQVSSSC